VLGSSNASTNGLALEHETNSGWHEANIRIDDTGALDGICIWFDDLFEAGYNIETEDLDRAESIWKTRKLIAPSGKRLARALFDAYRASPDNQAWQHVKIAYCRDIGIDQKDEKWISQEIEDGRLSSDISAYSEWNDIISSKDYIIDYDLTKSKPEYTGIWRVLPAGIHPATLRLVRKINRLPLGALGRFKVSDVEQEALAGISAEAVKRYSADGRNAVITIAQALALIDTPSKGGNPKAFERAMIEIYEEAKSFGYIPSIFRKMIADYGGVETARRLIRKPVTSGFEKLWENQRLDLSVEALIVRPEWRGLFTDEELALARKRLLQLDYRVPD